MSSKEYFNQVAQQWDDWMGFKREDVEGWFRVSGLRNVVVDCLDEDCCAESDSGDEATEVSIFVASGER